jgi:hypothetical protein
MAATPEASRLRQRIHQLVRERSRLEEDVLFAPQRPYRGSLLARHLGSGAARRTSVAHYLCRREGGRLRQHHVTHALVESVRVGRGARTRGAVALAGVQRRSLAVPRPLAAQEEGFPP